MNRKIKTFPFALCFLVSLFHCARVAGQDIPLNDPAVSHPYQRITVPNLAVITSTNTSNPAVAKAALAIITSASRLKCGNNFQIDHIADANTSASLRALVAKISGTLCTANGRTLRLAATFIPNDAIQANSVIVSIKEGEPLLAEWRNSLYVLYGVVYDEHVHPSGSQDNAIRELLLIDPRYSDKRREVVFERDKDNFAEVEGIATISETEK